jgi:Cu/Zn superoxide dismutase
MGMQRAMHIHANAPAMTATDPTKSGCNGVGDVWNGKSTNTHHKFDMATEVDNNRKIGDLGNVNISTSGSANTKTAQLMLFNDAITFDGDDSVNNRGVNIHIATDDYGQYAGADPDAKAASMDAGLSQDPGAAGGTSTGMANAIGCGAIKEMDKPKVKNTAHMEIDQTVTAATASSWKPSALTYQVTGKLTFEELEMPSGSNYATDLPAGDNHGTMTRITGTIKGLPDGMHGFHIHQVWTDGAPDCLHGTGYIYDPTDESGIPGGADKFDPFSTPAVLPSATGMMMHGAPANAYMGTRLTGDMGNVISSTDGVALVYIMDPELQVSGSNTIVGHSVDIHLNMDTLQGPLPDGAAGAADPLDKVGDLPIACGEIKKGSYGMSAGTIALIVITVLAGVAMIVGGVFYYKKKQAQEEYDQVQLNKTKHTTAIRHSCSPLLLTTLACLFILTSFAQQMDGQHADDYKPPLLEVQTHGVGNSL